jgi:MFS family permease
VRRTGLAADRDFLKLWAGQTVSVFGTLVSRTALPFTAILLLDVGPLELGFLRAAELVPALFVGLLVGVWVDRLRRRRLMIVADAGRAAVLISVPVAAWLDVLRMEQLYVVALAVGLLSILFDVAYQAYLPGLVRREHLVEGNSKLAASASVAEVTAFGSGGWLVQLLTAPGAVVVDAASFVVSAISLAWIRRPEDPPAKAAERTSIRQEIAEGFRAVWSEPALRGLVGAALLIELANGFVGTVYLLYVTRDLGFEPGVLGLVFAAGGVAALAGAVFAGRVSTRFHLGGVLILTGAVAAAGTSLVTLAPGATLVGVLCLVAQQLIADSAATVFEIGSVSARQTLTPDQLLGRVNAVLRVGGLALTLAASLAAGFIADPIGLRATILVGVGVEALAAAWLFASPIRRLRGIPVAAREVSPA